MRTLRRPVLAAAALALLPTGAISQHGYHCGPPPPLTQPVVPLWRGVAGTVTQPISSRNDSTQAYFNQGLALIYGFNHLESVLSFRKAASFDPRCAICFWGIAIALGPNINENINQQRWEMAMAALDTARVRSVFASPVERRYIRAAWARYFNPDGSRPRIPSADSAFRRMRGEMDRRYANAMGDLWRTVHMRDLHLGAMYAEALMDLHPWDLWNRDGSPKWPETERVRFLVDSILAEKPDHIGAAHLKIHVYEGSTRPDLARREAGILEGLMPGSAHITHMPSHIHHRLGTYAAGVAHNQRATTLDREYLRFRGWMWRYPMYFAHDNDFLWVSGTFAGMRTEALASADSLNGIVVPELVRCYASAEHFLTAPILVRVRFGMWREALAQPRPPQGYDYAVGMWHYARGWALLRTGDHAGARLARDSADAYAVRLRGRTIANNPADTLVRIAVHTLTGEIEAAGRNFSGAVLEMQQAVALQDGLEYDEPPPFFYPARHSLGAVLVESRDRGNAMRALGVYQADLGHVGGQYDVNRNPRNAWAYVGMARALEMLGVPSGVWLARATEVWQGGDLPPASRY